MMPLQCAVSRLSLNLNSHGDPAEQAGFPPGRVQERSKRMGTDGTYQPRHAKPALPELELAPGVPEPRTFATCREQLDYSISHCPDYGQEANPFTHACEAEPDNDDNDEWFWS